MQENDAQNHFLCYTIHKNRLQRPEVFFSISVFRRESIRFLPGFRDDFNLYMSLRKLYNRAIRFFLDVRWFAAANPDPTNNDFK